MRQNRLAHETSPYLLQHARNPVDWYPWGKEALDRARAEDKPILLSIGYSACHWCHVMERESFEDEAIAAAMNRDFVCVKVDREERPDLDEIYMKATQAMNHGHGGWPMTVFLTPTQKPFYAGTYFPPQDRQGRPGLPTVLRYLAEVWRSKREEVLEQADKLTRLIAEQVPAGAERTVDAQALRTAAMQHRRDFDPQHGGFGHAPKFPPAESLRLLLRVHHRFGDGEALAMVTRTLDGMARGGMYDQIGGGFCRYSTDERWLVPHFEKMLYDNALLARAYLEAHQVTRDPFYRRIAVEILDYELREMVGAEGGFYSATDADSEGVEGKFFVWTHDEVVALLGPEEARRVAAWFDLTVAGNWPEGDESRSIANTPRTLFEVAEELGIAVAELERSIAAGRSALYAARARRVHPGLDDKILTGWNGLLIGALAEGYRVVGDRRYLEAATRCARFLLATLRRPDGRLLRTFRNGRAHLDACLEDYAYLGDGLVTLYEAGGEADLLDAARGLAERVIADFTDPVSGAFFTTAADAEPLIVRHRDGLDGATPNPNATAALLLLRLSYHLDRADLRRAGERALFAYGQLIDRHPRAFARSLAAVDLLDGGPLELVVLGAAADPRLAALRIALAEIYLPNRIIAHGDGAPSDLPLLAGKQLVDGRAALYVCHDQTCEPPIIDPGGVFRRLAATAKGAAGAVAATGGIPGHATPDATRHHVARWAPHGIGPLGATGLTVSRLGFGGYRVDADEPDHAEALTGALLSGCNLIDTSTNYSDGGSERLIGEVLASLVGGGRLDRAAIVVVSKLGYLQGQNLALARRREAEGRPLPEVVKCSDDLWHCLHPEFLAEQLTRSLARLGLATLDLCLLHNPEYFLAEAEKRRQGSLAERRRELYRRLTAAFAFLETQVAAGRIRGYGVSSNTCAAPADDPEATSLAELLLAAVAAGGAEHHFHALQLPLNLLEHGAVSERDGDGQTLLELAQARQIAVLANRPLNAIRGSGLVRLAEPGLGSDHIDEERQARTAAWARSELDPKLPPERRPEPLQRKALWVVASTPGVSCVLLGMRRRRHVEEALPLLDWPPLEGAANAYL